MNKLHKGTWFVKLLKPFPYPMVFMEAVRVGLDVSSWVRVTVLGFDCGIWKWS